MAWSVELSETADRGLSKLVAQRRKRILKFLHERVGKLDALRMPADAEDGRSPLATRSVRERGSNDNEDGVSRNIAGLTRAEGGT
jgi:mRNA-degrading endonuclease RelE of RelBE toxin-antitoxin system